MAGISRRSIADATITPELWLREVHAPNIEAEKIALRLLGDTLSTAPADAFQVCADLVLELCHADSCGISLRERSDGGEEIFRWIALAGQLKQHLHGTTPRHSSPCGLCVDGNEPLLMQRPELVYKYLDVGPPFHDVLLIPLTEKNGELEGTIWIVSHNTARKFDGEDARVMQRFALFTTTALRLAKIAQEAKREASEQNLRLRELDHRFNNTMAMTVSLLRRQLGALTDPDARMAIETARRRVQAMSLVHQLCSHTPTGDLAEVVKSVATNLVAADPRFELEVEAEPVIVPVEKATVVALISNELVTNAIKHAFPNREAGRIAVRLRRMDENSVALSVTDNGAPLVTHAQKFSGGIGLSLVARLADQLAGELRVDVEPKQFSVVFPVLA
jgi:two-component sensor histidine kinase